MMTTVLQNPDGGRRMTTMHRPHGQSLSESASLRSEERNQMVFKSIAVDHDLSILGMLRLNDSDNILISTTESLWKCRDMLLGRLAKMNQHDVQLHLRANLLDLDLEKAVQSAQQGAQVVFWQTEPPSGMPVPDTLTVVQSRRANTSRDEGFMVIKTPLSSRILAAWKEGTKVVGVLVTNPRTVEKIANQLTVIVQSSAR
jgi:hypothetical protein